MNGVQRFGLPTAQASNDLNGGVKVVLLSTKDDPNDSDQLVKSEDAINAASGRH